jgi:hypothetical protein
MPIHRHCVVALVALVTAARAQVDALPTEHTLLVPPNALVDLDTGVILPQRDLLQARADMWFSRDGAGFFADPLHGGMVAVGDASSPTDEWIPNRLRVGNREASPRVWFVRTDRGSIARVTLALVDSYSTGSAVLQWVLVPSAMGTFAPAPTDLVTTWQGVDLVASWHGDAASYLVELDSGGQVQKTTVSAARAVFPGLAPDGVHRVRVRGLLPAGVVTLPTDAVQHGRRRPPVRGEVQYGDRWYDSTGGLSLLRGEAVVEDADVVFYLYGVFVPRGGGVLKLGSGAECYRAVSELPASGYLPVYGRLDDHDVLAVRLPDGRHGKIWLEPSPGTDVRSGMVVHFTLLVDGRRSLLPPPERVDFAMAAGGLRLSWPAVASAVRYRVRCAGLAKPLEVQVPEVLLPGLAANRMHLVEVAAVDGDGGESDPRMADVNTYDAGYRSGTFALECQRDGYDLLSGTKVPLAGGDPPPALDLQFVGGAGNYNGMRFRTPHGAGSYSKLAFGEFPPPETLAESAFGPTFYSDDRQPGFECFLLRTHDGGLASIRIRKRDNRAVFDYVLRLPAR